MKKNPPKQKDPITEERVLAIVREELGKVVMRVGPITDILDKLR